MEESEIRAHQLTEICQQADRLLAALEIPNTPPRKTTKFGRQEIHRRAALLIEECHTLGLSPPLPLSTLVARCLRVKADPFIVKSRDLSIAPENYAAWDRATLFEAEHNPTFGSRLTAPLNTVAKAAFPETHGKDSDHRQTIRKWRRTKRYRLQIDMLRTPVGRYLLMEQNQRK